MKISAEKQKMQNNTGYAGWKTVQRILIFSNSEEAAVGRLCGFPCIQKGLPVKALADINKRNGLHEPYEI